MQKDYLNKEKIKEIKERICDICNEELDKGVSKCVKYHKYCRAESMRRNDKRKYKYKRDEAIKNGKIYRKYEKRNK